MTIIKQKLHKNNLQRSTNNERYQREEYQKDVLLFQLTIPQRNNINLHIEYCSPIQRATISTLL